MKKLIANLAVILCALMVFYFIYQYNQEHNNKIFAQQKKEFLALNFKDSCNCEIISIYDETSGGLTIRNNPNGVHLFCRNRGKLSVYTSTLELGSNKTLDEVINRGVMIYKVASNDTIHLFDKIENKKYKFLISNK